MSANIYDDYWKKRVDGVIINNPGIYLREFKNFNTKLSYRSLFNYLHYIIHFCDGLRKDISEVSMDDFTNFLAETRDTSPSNQVVAYAALKKYNKYLFASGKVKTDFMAMIDRPSAMEKQSTIEKRAKGFLNPTEIKTLIKTVKDSDQWVERDLFMIELFLSTGLRLSGLWKLSIDDIDIVKKVLVTTEKRGKVRVYPLSDILISLYNAWLNIRNKYVRNNEKALFISKYGTRISTVRIQKIVAFYTKDIEGKHISPHKLRATYGTQIYNVTKDLYLTQQAMGHSSPKTTELYIRGQENTSMNKALDIMTNILT